jgi:DNA-binding NarL/FixJ family response regulator
MDQMSLNCASEILMKIGAKAALQKLRRDAKVAGVAGISRGAYSASKGNIFGLTGKELETLEMLVRGLTNEAIASKQSRSIRTIENHVSAILGKTGAASRNALMHMVQTEKWLKGKQ